MSPADAGAALAAARAALVHAARALEEQAARLDERFVQAVEVLHAARGKVVLSGVGKSGLVAQRLAATLTSTGTPAFFLHPTEAAHGDAGILQPGDAALFVSKSGGSEELEPLIGFLDRLEVPLVAITSRAASPLGRAARVVLETGDVPEAGPLASVPTTSAVVAQALGDALALALVERRGFKEADFSLLHPGGVLGRALRLSAADLMHAGAALPRVDESTGLHEVLVEILEKRLGITTVTGAAGTLGGVITDGDLKRILLKQGAGSAPLWSLTAAAVMSRAPKTCLPDTSLAAAVRLMESSPGGAITALVVVAPDSRPVGVLHLHDCLRAGWR